MNPCSILHTLVGALEDGEYIVIEDAANLTHILPDVAYVLDVSWHIRLFGSQWLLCWLLSTSRKLSIMMGTLSSLPTNTHLHWHGEYGMLFDIWPF